MSEGTTVRQPMPPPKATSLHDHNARVTPDASRPGPLRPMGRVDPPPLEPYVPRPTQRHEDEHHRKVRPSALQKMVKKYDGSGDPYDHVAAYRQAVHAEQVRDVHTQIEGFGLTLEGKALTWFQTLKPGVKESLTRLEKDFIFTFSKIGIKHNTVGQIHNFKQKDHESVKDCVSRLKQLYCDAWIMRNQAKNN